MIYLTEQLLEKYHNFYGVNKAVEKGKLYKVGHGLYSDVNPSLCELEIIFMIYPNSVLTLESAFAFYSLSDYVPTSYNIATNQNAHKINNDKVTQIYMTNNILDIGKQVINTKYGSINIYDKERLLIELFRFKSKLDYSYFKEVINAYRQLEINNELDNHKLIKYCSMFRNGDSLRQKIQDMIL